MAGCGSTDMWIHVGTGPGCIEGHVEGGWTCRKGPKHVSTRRYMSERVRTVVGGLGKALACGYVSVQVGACWCTWIHVGMGPGCIEGCVEGGWTHGKGPKCISTHQYTVWTMHQHTGVAQRGRGHKYFAVRMHKQHQLGGTKYKREQDEHVPSPGHHRRCTHTTCSRCPDHART